MHVTCITNFDELAPLAGEWRCLTRGVPFRDAPWLFNWWRHYADDSQLWVLAVRGDDGSLVGAAPWLLEQGRGAGRVIKFLGSGEVCTDYLSILATREHENGVVAAIAQWLSDAARGEQGPQHAWDLIDLEGVTSSDPAVAKLVAHLHEEGCSVTRQTGISCWRVPLPESWDEYLSGLSKAHGRQVRRTTRRVLEHETARVVTADDLTTLDAGMQILVDLHQRRWQSLGQPGCFASPRFTGFLHDAAPQLLAAGLLQLAWLEFEDRPLAVEFNLVNRRACYMYQGGIDPDRQRLAPGRALLSALIRRAIERGQPSYDFLRGDEAYKAKWGARPIATLRIRITPNRLGPQIRSGVWLAGQTMKSWIKSGLHLSGMH